MVGEHGRPNSRRESKDLLTNHVKTGSPVCGFNVTSNSRVFSLTGSRGSPPRGGVSSKLPSVTLGPSTGLTLSAGWT